MTLGGERLRECDSRVPKELNWLSLFVPQDFFESVTSVANSCAPRNAFSQRQIEGDALHRDDDEEASAMDMDIRMQEGAQEQHKEEEAASVRPRSATSRLPTTADVSYLQLKGQLWGLTRDVKFGAHA